MSLDHMNPSGRVGNSSWAFSTNSVPPQQAIASNSYRHASSSAGSSITGASGPTTQVRSAEQVIEKESLLPRTCVAPSVRTLFSFEFFNAMQSHCFNALYRSGDNVVIGAPTAAGKTVCFELAMASLFSAATPKKALYIAPLKSLVQERLRDWQKKLKSLGLLCQEITGDSGEALQPNVSVYLTTPEKWDAITRHWKENDDILQHIALILLDEIHILADDRGASLEAVITRTKFLTSSSPPRMVALSASTPNIKDIGEWIGAPERSIFFFGEEHRPITPRLHVIGYPPCKNDFLFEKSLDFKLWNIIATHSENKPTLVFVSSRKSTITSASKLLEMCSERGSSFVKSSAQKERLFEAARKVQGDPQLSACVMNGIAYHNAGMSSENRGLIERLFATGEDIMVVVATSTLAAGVNLPAFLVVIKSTTVWSAEKGAEECSPAIIRQMIGRAGRPQFGDTSASAVIMTKQTKVASYESILHCDLASIESVLHQHLHDTLLTEISLGNVTSFKSAFAFLQQTYLKIRLCSNPSHYANAIAHPPGTAPIASQPAASTSSASSHAESTTATSSTLFKHRPGPSTSTDPTLPIGSLPAQLRAWCLTALAALSKTACIVVENQNLAASDLGRALTRNFVSFQAVQAFSDSFPSLPSNPDPSLCFDNLSRLSEADQMTSFQIFESVCSSPQFSDVVVRRTEKQELKRISSENRFQVVKGMGKPQKILTLVQTSIDGKVLEQSLRQEVPSLLASSISLLACLSQFLLHRGMFYTLHRTLLLWKSLKRGCWSQRSQQTSQVPIITKDMAKRLANVGCSTLTQLGQMEPKSLEQILQRNPQFISSIYTRLQSIPKYSLSVRIAETQERATEIYFIARPLGIQSNLSDFRWLVLGKHGQILAYRQLHFNGQSDRPVSFKIPLVAGVSGLLDLFFVSEDWIGFDIVGTISVDHLDIQELQVDDEMQDFYQDVPIKTKKRKRTEPTPAKQTLPSSTSTQVYCNHKCQNKFTCKHECCKSHPDVKTSGATSLHLEGRSGATGLISPPPKRLAPLHSQSSLTESAAATSAHDRTHHLPNQPNIKIVRHPAEDHPPASNAAFSPSSTSSASQFRPNVSEMKRKSSIEVLQPTTIITTRPTQSSSFLSHPPKQVSQQPSCPLTLPNATKSAFKLPGLLPGAKERSQVRVFGQSQRQEFPLETPIVPIATAYSHPASSSPFPALHHPQPSKFRARPSLEEAEVIQEGRMWSGSVHDDPKMDPPKFPSLPLASNGWSSLLNWELDLLGPEA